MTRAPLALIALLGALLWPLQGQASISSDIEAGLPADTVIANALAEGLTIDQIADQIAQEVGSDRIGLFAGPLRRTLAVATDMDDGDTGLVTAVFSAIGQAAGRGHSGRQVGRAYALNSTNYQPASASSIRAITGVLGISTAAPTFAMVSAVGRPAAVAVAGAAPSGGGGGQGVQDAICEAVGSEPGCLE